MCSDSIGLVLNSGCAIIAVEQRGICLQFSRGDAFGRYRDPDTWEVFTSTPALGGVFDPDVIDMPVWFNRGYTGHEHLREFDLINMNGRLYDPIPGRMLSADNYVQEPGNSQSYNRYAYVMNNPLKYTDPNGEWLIAAAAAVVVAAASYIIGAGKNGWEWNPSKWTSGDGVGIGFTTNSAGTTSLYGFGNIGNANWKGGYGANGEGFGGGLSTFGQASYNQMPSAGTGSINWKSVKAPYNETNSNGIGLHGETVKHIPENYITDSRTIVVGGPTLADSENSGSKFAYQTNSLTGTSIDLTWQNLQIVFNMGVNRLANPINVVQPNSFLADGTPAWTFRDPKARLLGEELPEARYFNQNNPNLSNIIIFRWIPYRGANFFNYGISRNQSVSTRSPNFNDAVFPWPSGY